MDGYLHDFDFVDAIKEDYPIIIKYLKLQVKMLEKLESIDPSNKFLEEHSIKSIQKKVDEFTEENQKFLADSKQAFNDQLKKAYADNIEEQKESVDKKEPEKEKKEPKEGENEEIFL